MARLIEGKEFNEVERSHTLIEAGRERLRVRWATDPVGLVVTYVVMKPAAAWLIPFYWDKVFGINGFWVLRIHAMLSVFGFVLLGWYSVRSGSRAEFLLMFLNVLIITVGASYYLGLSRYVYPYVPFLYVAVAFWLDSVVRRASRVAADSCGRRRASRTPQE